MSATTPKSHRQPPPRRFENYIFTRSTGAGEGLTNVDDRLFSPCSPANSATPSDDPGVGFVLDALSAILQIGFEFQIDNVTYTKFVASSAGWMALISNQTATFTLTDIFHVNAVNSNNTIKTSVPFSQNHVLLAPWFDNIQNVASDVKQVGFGATKRERVRNGLETPPAYLNETRNSVKYHTDTKSPKGRRLIVRWNSTYNPTTTIPPVAMRFEVVLYENGTIEFRYEPRRTIAAKPSPEKPQSGQATIGIFMPNGTNRFRDMSYGLGHRDDLRQEYKFGAAVYDPNYSDNGRPYSIRLTAESHWPGLANVGSMMTFATPTLLRRVLPRLDIRQLDAQQTLPVTRRVGDERVGNDGSMFDDRRTPIHVQAGLNPSGILTGAIVSAPLMIQRFYGDTEPSTTIRQSLFSNDFLFTGSTSRSTPEQFISIKPQRYIAPFSENKRFNDPSDAFFASGSNIDELGDGLSQPTFSKTQIRLSLPVDNTCKLLGTSSQMMYYNKKSATWGVPQNSTYVLSASAATTNDSGISKGDLVKDATDYVDRYMVEDVRGFGPIGNLVSSGTNNGGLLTQSDFYLGSVYTNENATIAMSREYAKSLSNNEEYAATQDETFTLPINQPFLLEKAVIEVPFAAGTGWFSDKTTCFSVISGDATIDFAGPALTVSLFNQTKIGSKTRRDLVISGTFTHEFDNTKDIVFSQLPEHSPIFYARPVGFKAFDALAGAVVSPTNRTANTFTGSVAVKCEAQITNGILAGLEMRMTTANIPLNRTGCLDVFNSRRLNVSNAVMTNHTQSCRIHYVDVFGRGATGFEPSGRSVFGKEYATTDKIDENWRVANPFYMTGTNGGAVSPTFVGLPTQFAQAINTGSTFIFSTLLPLTKHVASPYLLMPGDQLVLGVSKTRPVVFSRSWPAPHTTGSITHDAQLITGSVNITLFGSLLKEGREHHDTLNQQLSSDAIHELVAGGEPVVDQFEVDYRSNYISGSRDDVIAGKLITKVVNNDGRIKFVTGSVYGSRNFQNNVLSVGTRGRIFGKSDARAARAPGTSEYDLSYSHSYRLQPYFEKAGTPRVNQCVDLYERYWDSLMPGISDLFAADGTGIFVLHTTGSAIGSLDYYIGNPYFVDQQSGFIWLDFMTPLLLPNIGNVVNGSWTKAYPFEPRYSKVSRQQFIERSLIARYSVEIPSSGPTIPIVHSIPPKQLNGLYFGPVGAVPSVPAKQHQNLAMLLTTGSSGYARHFYHWVCDSDLSQVFDPGGLSFFLGPARVITGSANFSDTLKFMFGFGDVNNIIKTIGEDSQFISGSMFGGTRLGTNHWPDCRNKGLDVGPFGLSGNTGPLASNWLVSPLIRGWKYGVHSALPSYTKAYFRPKSFGQVRDMLEQRQYTKFFLSDESGRIGDNLKKGMTEAAVTVRFVDSTGRTTRPENTWSQNLSTEATSSVPYFDGETRNRPDINQNTLNTNIISLRQNRFGQVTL